MSSALEVSVVVGCESTEVSAKRAFIQPELLLLILFMTQELRLRNASCQAVFAFDLSRAPPPAEKNPRARPCVAKCALPAGEQLRGDKSN